MGRISSYTPELAAKICERLAAGESLKTICSDDDMPSEATVRGWVIDDKEGFAAPYCRARDVGLDCLADATIAIADTPVEGTKTVEKPLGDEVTRGDMIEHRRLQVDTRKWYLAKLAPKRYGERLAHEISGPNGGPVVLDDVARAARIEAIFAAAKRRRDGDSGEDLV